MDKIHYLEGVEVEVEQKEVEVQKEKEVEVKKEAEEEVEGKWEAILGFLQQMKKPMQL